jgi:signal transduction histidine kinase
MTTSEQTRLELLRAFNAELTKPGEARERLTAAFKLLLGAVCQHVALEIYEPTGARTRIAVASDAASEASVGQSTTVHLASRQQGLGIMTVSTAAGLGFTPTDRAFIDLVAHEVSTYLRTEYFTGAEQSALENLLLLGTVSHDLRNPLGIVTFAAAALLESDLSAAQRKTVQRMMTAGRQSARLVSDLLDFTAARSGGIKLIRVTRDLHAIVDQALDDLRSIWPGRELEHKRVGDGRFSLDEDRMLQIIMNLVGNALQHSPATSTVRVETRGAAGTVEFSVTNEGRPIPPELMSQLFLPLRRGESAGYRPGSLGLGLFIVHHLVLAHGGTIDVVSNETEGTRFTIRLPDTASAPAH